MAFAAKKSAKSTTPALITRTAEKPAEIYRPYKGPVDQISHPIHVLLYGRTGARKSSMAATFPTPRLVLAFDPSDKMTPYRKAGETVVPYTDEFYTALKRHPQDEAGLRVDHVLDANGELLTRIEYYDDPDPEFPSSYARYIQRSNWLARETGWGTTILDSITSMQEAYFRHQMYTMNPDYKDPRLWYGHMKTEMVNQLKARFAHLASNTVVIGHIDKGKDEFTTGILHGVSAVGTLSGDLPTAFGETYLAHIIPDKVRPDQSIGMLQTRINNLFFAASQVDAPDPCVMDYQALWANWGK